MIRRPIIGALLAAITLAAPALATTEVDPTASAPDATLAKPSDIELAGPACLPGTDAVGDCDKGEAEIQLGATTTPVQPAPTLVAEKPADISVDG